MADSSSKRAPLNLVDFYDDVLEKIFGYIRRPIDRNSISAVCKRFHRLESKTREHVLVYNMYAVSPTMMFERFPNVTSITMKGNPRLVDFDILPREWAGHAGAWIDAIKAHPQLNRFRIKRMMITDGQIEDLCSSCGPNLKTLIFDKCNGFSSKGLESIAKYCKNLTTLGLAQSVFEGSTTWLIDLVSSCRNLEVLDLSLVELGEVEDSILVQLASRCKVLRLWETLSTEQSQLDVVLENCSPNLTDLGILRIKSGNAGPSRCKGLEGLSGIYDLADGNMEAFATIAPRLKRLDLSYSILTQGQIAEVLEACPNLEQLRALNQAGDQGVEALGRTCKNLKKLVVESSSQGDVDMVSHRGLIAVAQGCKNLQKLIFYPCFMTNAALVTLATNCVHLTDVRMNLMRSDNQLPWEPNLDAGVGALVMRCQSLSRLTLSFDAGTESPLLTDKGLFYIGEYGKKIRLLTLVNCGSSDTGLKYILNGCSKLQRLEVRQCPFGDESMVPIAAERKEVLHLKYLFIKGCDVDFPGLKTLARRAVTTKSKFYVEVIGCRREECLQEHREQCQDASCEEEHRYTVHCLHWQVLAYHSLTEPRADMPWFISLFPSDDSTSNQELEEPQTWSHILDEPAGYSRLNLEEPLDQEQPLVPEQELEGLQEELEEPVDQELEDSLNRAGYSTLNLEEPLDQEQELEGLQEELEEPADQELEDPLDQELEDPLNQELEEPLDQELEVQELLLDQGRVSQGLGSSENMAEPGQYIEEQLEALNQEVKEAGDIDLQADLQAGGIDLNQPGYHSCAVAA